MNTTDYLITCMLNCTLTLSPNLTVIACLNSISIYFFFLLFLRSDFNCACLFSEHPFWQCRSHLYPPVTFNAFETSMYLPAVLNNNGDKLKKKRERESMDPHAHKPYPMVLEPVPSVSKSLPD